MVQIMSTTASSAAEDLHATCTFGFCASEVHQTPAIGDARSALGLVLSGAVAREGSKGTVAVTIGCIDTSGRNLAGAFSLVLCFLVSLQGRERVFMILLLIIY